MNALLEYLQAFGDRAKELGTEPQNYLAGLLQSLPDRNSLQGAVKDPEFYKGLLGNTKEMAGGLLTGALGAPVDIATMMMRPGGYNVPDKNVVGSSNHLAGLLGLDAESTPYKVGSLLPSDPGDAIKYGGLLGMAGSSKMGGMGDDIMRGADNAVDAWRSMSRAQMGEYVDDLKKQADALREVWQKTGSPQDYRALEQVSEKLNPVMTRLVEISDAERNLGLTPLSAMQKNIKMAYEMGTPAGPGALKDIAAARKRGEMTDEIRAFLEWSLSKSPGNFEIASELAKWGAK